MATRLSSVVGGGQQQYQLAQRIQPQALEENQTLNAVIKMAGQFADKMLQQNQQEQFVKGMQRVAAGEAYTDIRKESNGFAESLFGRSASMQGAAAMAKVAAVDEFNTEAMNQMQGNAGMSPKDFRDYLVNGMSKHLTGDADVDNVIQSKMVENMAPLMKAQAKANYAWTQQESARQYTKMVGSAGDALFATAGQRADGLLSEGDMIQAQQRAILASVQPAGMNPETYRKTLLDTSIAQMAKGNLWLDKTYQRAGMYDGLDADDQVKLENARKTYSTRAAEQIGSMKYGNEIALIVGGAAGRSPAQNAELWNDLNEKWMAESGSDYGMLGMKDLIGMQKSMYSRTFAMQDKYAELAAKAASDARAKNELVSTLQRGIDNGMGGYLTAMGAKSSEVDVSFDAQWQAKLAANPQLAVNQMLENYNHGMGYINPQVQSRMLEPLRRIQGGGVPGAGLDTTLSLVDMMSSTPESQAALDAYLGSEFSSQLEGYRNAVVGFNGDKVKAAQLVFGTPAVKAPKIDSKELKAEALKAVQGSVQGTGFLNWVDRTFRGLPDMSEASQDMMLTAISPDVQVYMNAGVDANTAVQRAMKGAGARKVDVLGRYAYRKNENQQPLAALAGMDDRTMSLVFPKFLQEKARNMGVYANVPNAKSGVSKPGQAHYFTSVTDLGGFFGGKDSDATLLRAPDAVGPDGKPVAVFTGMLYNGEKNANINFTSRELTEFYENQVRGNLGGQDITEILRKAGL